MKRLFCILVLLAGITEVSAQDTDTLTTGCCPYCCCTSWKSCCSFGDGPLISSPDTVAVVIDTIDAPVVEKGKDKGFGMYVRTDAVLLAAMVPNISVEVPLGKDWTVSGRYHHSWWKSRNGGFIWKTYGGSLGVRRYFRGKKEYIPYCGHHVGLTGTVLTYNFLVGEKGVLASRPGGILSLEYGYTFRIGQRFSVDINCGFGYHGGIYEEYIPLDGHLVWQATRRRNYIGLTCLELGLRWDLGKKEVRHE